MPFKCATKKFLDNKLEEKEEEKISLSKEKKKIRPYKFKVNLQDIIIYHAIIKKTKHLILEIRKTGFMRSSAMIYSFFKKIRFSLFANHPNVHNWGVTKVRFCGCGCLPN